jgi:hypothetical protein
LDRRRVETGQLFDRPTDTGTTTTTMSEFHTYEGCDSPRSVDIVFHTYEGCDSPRSVDIVINVFILVRFILIVR